MNWTKTQPHLFRRIFQMLFTLVALLMMDDEALKVMKDKRVDNSIDLCAVAPLVKAFLVLAMKDTRRTKSRHSNKPPLSWNDLIEDEAKGVLFENVQGILEGNWHKKDKMEKFLGCLVWIFRNWWICSSTRTSTWVRIWRPTTGLVSSLLVSRGTLCAEGLFLNWRYLTHHAAEFELEALVQHWKIEVAGPKWERQCGFNCVLSDLDFAVGQVKNHSMYFRRHWVSNGNEEKNGVWGAINRSQFSSQAKDKEKFNTWLITKIKRKKTCQEDGEQRNSINESPSAVVADENHGSPQHPADDYIRLF